MEGSTNNFNNLETGNTWGENDPNAHEPLSGVRGDVSRGEPYDAGNMDEASQQRVERSVDDSSNSSAFRENMSERPTESSYEESVPSFARTERPTQEMRDAGDSSFGRNNEQSAQSRPQESFNQSQDEQVETSEAPSETKGTGEAYVHTTGLAADGGDFDATKPGAGREAERIMEEKGMHRDGDEFDDQSQSQQSQGGKDKPSLGHRIKEKLHR